MEKEKYFAYWLSQVKGIGAGKAEKLLSFAGSYEAIYNMKKEDLEKQFFLRKQDKKELWDEKESFSFRCKEADSMKKKGIRMVLPTDPEYPARFRNMYDMPQWIFVKGTLPKAEEPSAAVIGARSCTSYGKQEAEGLGKLLSQAGISVISGLALGIDGAAHRGVVWVQKQNTEAGQAAGKPFAVLGSGIDVCYPAAHQELYEEICACGGGILSEYGLGEAPCAGHFPVRNRLISALSDVVVVVEARGHSGSLITAELALEQGKEVFAFPGRRTDPLSVGCNRLIQDGAAMLTDPQELFGFFPIPTGKLQEAVKKSVNGLAKTEKMVYSCLDLTPKPVEEIMECGGLSVGECMTALLNLELNGYILQPINHHYVRKLE